MIAGLCLLSMAVPKAGWAQFPPTLFYVWMLVAGIVLTVRARSPHATAAVGSA